MNTKLFILALALNLSLSLAQLAIPRHGGLIGSRGLVGANLLGGGVVRTGIVGAPWGVRGGLVGAPWGVRGGLVGGGWGARGLVSNGWGVRGGLIGSNVIAGRGLGWVGGYGLAGGLVANPGLVAAPVATQVVSAPLVTGAIASPAIGLAGGLAGYSNLLATYRASGGLGLHASLYGDGLIGGPITGPVPAAIETIRTRSEVLVPTSRDPIVPTDVVVGPNIQPVNIEFVSQSSPINPTQRHIPGRPGTVQETASEEEPDILRHSVVKPIIQEVRETVVPFRRITQEVLPVQEQTHTLVARGEERQVVAAPAIRAVAAPVAVRQAVAVAPAVTGVVAAAPAVAVARPQLVQGVVAGNVIPAGAVWTGGNLVNGGVGLVNAGLVSTGLVGGGLVNGGVVSGGLVPAGNVVTTGGVVAAPGQWVGSSINRFGGAVLGRNLELIKA